MGRHAAWRAGHPAPECSVPRLVLVKYLFAPPCSRFLECCLLVPWFPILGFFVASYSLIFPPRKLLFVRRFVLFVDFFIYRTFPYIFVHTFSSPGRSRTLCPGARGHHLAVALGPLHALAVPYLIEANRNAQVLDKGIHITKRDMFYTDVKLFKEQGESDAVLEDVACMVGCTRSCLNVVASDKGLVIGRVTFLEDGTSLLTALVPLLEAGRSSSSSPFESPSDLGSARYRDEELALDSAFRPISVGFPNTRSPS